MTIFWILNILFLSSAVQIPQPTPDGQVIAQLFSQLIGYSYIIYHYETSTKDYLQLQKNVTKFILLVNYDLRNLFKMIIWETGSKRIHFISFNKKEYFELFKQETYGLNYRDTALVMDDGRSKSSIEFLDSLYYLSNVFYYNEELFQCEYLGKHCYLNRIVHETESGTVIDIGTRNKLQLGHHCYKVGAVDDFANLRLR